MKLTLIRGIPGSGKSTLGRRMEISFSDCVKLEADMYMHNASGAYTFDARKLKDAHAWCQTTAHAMLVAGKHIVVCNTFIKIWELGPYLTMARDLNCEIEIIKVNGGFDSTQKVPKDVIDRMLDTYEPHPDEVCK